MCTSCEAAGLKLTSTTTSLLHPSTQNFTAFCCNIHSLILRSRLLKSLQISWRCIPLMWRRNHFPAAEDRCYPEVLVSEGLTCWETTNLRKKSTWAIKVAADQTTTWCSTCNKHVVIFSQPSTDPALPLQAGHPPPWSTRPCVTNSPEPETHAISAFLWQRVNLYQRC